MLQPLFDKNCLILIFSQRLWGLFGMVLLSALGKNETAIKSQCQWAFENQNEQKICEANIAKVDDENFTILSKMDNSIEGFHILSKKGVNFLPTNLLCVMPNLISIKICGCSVKLVNENHFKGLSKLQTLNLTDNKLENITSNAFADLSNLERLDLSSNKIRHLDKSTFASLKALKFLLLYKNVIQFLHFEIFAFLVNIEDIKVGGNEIQRLDDNLFKNNSNLKGIFLRRNKIKYVARNTFDNLPKLKNVYLDENLCVDKNYSSSHFESMKEDLEQNCSVFSELKKLGAELTDMKMELNGKTQKNDDLQEEIAAYKQDILAVKSMYETLSDDFRDINRTLQALTPIRETVLTFDSLRKKLESNVSKLETKLNEKFETINSTNEKLNSTQEGLKISVRDLSLELSEQNKTLKTLREKIKELNHKNDTLTGWVQETDRTTQASPHFMSTKNIAMGGVLAFCVADLFILLILVIVYQMFRYQNSLLTNSSSRHYV